MAELTRRLQLLLDPEQMEHLQTIARQRHTSVAELIRSAVDRVYSPRTDLGPLRVLEELRHRHWISAEAVYANKD